MEFYLELKQLAEQNPQLFTLMELDFSVEERLQPRYSKLDKIEQMLQNADNRAQFLAVLSGYDLTNKDQIKSLITNFVLHIHSNSICAQMFDILNEFFVENYLYIRHDIPLVSKFYGMRDRANESVDVSLSMIGIEQMFERPKDFATYRDVAGVVNITLYEVFNILINISNIRKIVESENHTYVPLMPHTKFIDDLLFEKSDILAVVFVRILIDML